MPAALNAVFGMPPGTSGGYILPNVTHTYSAHGPAGGPAAWRWHYVLAVSLQRPFTLPAADLGPPLDAAAGGYAVFDWFALGGGGPVGALAANGSYTIPTGQGLPSPPAGAHALRYLLVAPVLPGGWVLLGEAGKLVPMSRLRTSNVTVHAGGPAGAGFSAAVVTSPGTGGERVTYAVLPPPGAGGATGTTPLAVACPDKGGADAALACFVATGCDCA